MSILRILPILLVGISCVTSATTTGDDVAGYLCKGKYAVGYSFNEQSQEWMPTNFSPDIYLIKKPDNNDYAPSNAVLAVYTLEKKNKTLSYWCNNSFNEAGFIFCDGVGGRFSFNKENGRFIRVSDIGYVQAQALANSTFKEPEGSDDPVIEIGTCTVNKN